MNSYPQISDLRKRAHKRMPFVAKEYLETGTDNDVALGSNRNDLDKIKLLPQILKGSLNPSLKTQLLGRSYSAPFGVAPLGIPSLMWPRAEHALASMAAEMQIPFCLSTVASESPSGLQHAHGDMGWYQLYVPKEKELSFKLMDNAKKAGFHTLVVTVDIPIPSRRQRTKRAGLTTPLTITPKLLLDALCHPTWTMGTIRHGVPRLKTIEEHAEFKSLMSVGKFVRSKLGGNLDWTYLDTIRRYWDGPTIVKGVMDVRDADRLVKEGYDAIWVSNHGGRQSDLSPSSISVLPQIARLIDKQVPIVFDSGIRSGNDILRALACGADFVFLGRPWLYGVAALGKLGAYHTCHILKEEMMNGMYQLGIDNLTTLSQKTMIYDNE